MSLRDGQNEMQAYAEKAAETAIYPEEVGLLYCTLGLAGEAGEVANKVKKAFRDDHGVITEGRKAMILDELGDVLWYLVRLAHELGYSFNDVAMNNVLKLEERASRNVIKGDGDVR